jgi:hypothetical protein
MCERKVTGVAANTKETSFRDVKLSTGAANVPTLEFAMALDEAKIEILEFMQYTPTCVSQNFICYYTIEAFLQHADMEGSKRAQVEFELFFTTSSDLIELLSQMQKK